MKKTTRFKFNAYLQQVAKLNGITDVGDVGKKFSVEPSVTQSLMNVVQESSEFLTRINMTPVAELKGEKVGVGVNGSIASTTDTDGGKERQTADFTSLESNKYECQQVNFDFHMRYNQLDLWARYQDFQLRIRNAIAKRQALDFIMAGFNGISRAATSDRAKNPMLQDVAVGWLQKYRNEADGDDAKAAQRVVRQWLAKKGITAPHLVMENGSGLSRAERVSAREMAAMLQAAWKSPYAAEYISSLPIAGTDGTMRKRLKTTAMRGEAHVKTGTLNTVRAIAGFSRDNNGNTWAVVAILNDPKPWGASSVLDQVLLDLYRQPKVAAAAPVL